jgi:ATP-dependent RNA helicase DeaD
MVILDEADVMLDMGFHEDIEFILQGVPKERQTVFFSATMPRPIQELIRKYSRDAQNVRIEQRELTVPTVEQSYYEVDRRFKGEVLTRLIDLYDLRLGIIFCNTKRMVDDLVDHLNAQGYSADRLHGDMSQPMRDRVMNKFRKAGLEFLVATDVAARGIDVENVQVVFNYDPPYGAEDYLHRIGRTGRAGRAGRAITFVSGREVYQIQQIERYTKVRMQRGRVPTPGEVDEARQNVFLDKLRVTLRAGKFKCQDHVIEALLEEGFSSTDIASALLHHLQGDVDAPAKPSKPESSSKPARLVPTVENVERPARPVVARATPGLRKTLPATRAEAPVKPTPAPRPAVKGTRHGIRITESAAPVAPAIAEKVSAPAAPAAAIVPEAAPVAPAAAVAPAIVPAAPVVDIAPALIPPAAQPKAKPAVKSAVKPALAPAAPAAKPVAAPSQAERADVASKHSHRTPDGQTRLYMSVGSEMAVAPADVVQAIMGQTGLPAAVVGAVDIRERHLFVDVAAEHANAIIAKLNRSSLRNRRLKVKLA